MAWTLMRGKVPTLSAFKLFLWSIVLGGHLGHVFVFVFFIVMDMSCDGFMTGIHWRWCGVSPVILYLPVTYLCFTCIGTDWIC